MITIKKKNKLIIENENKNNIILDVEKSLRKNKKIDSNDNIFIF